MRVGVVGMNFKTSSLEIREQLAKACHYAFSPNSLEKRLRGAILLSTCNRTEIYFSGGNLAEIHREILAILREFMDAVFEQKLYSFFGQDCFLHLTKVASGLDSAILAETEIQQQVRLAYSVSAKAYPLDAVLHFLFQKTLKISKTIRSQFSLPRGLASLESIVVELALNSGMREVLLIGNSQINRQIVNALQRRNTFSLTLCTRSTEEAEVYAKEKQIELVGWEALFRWQKWGIVICATQHPGYLLSSCKEVKRHLLIDLSIPRLIDPALSHDPRIHLLNIEEISSLVDGRGRKFLSQVNDSQELLEHLVQECLETQQKRLRSYICA